MKIKEYFKVVLILPGNVLVTIPFLIFLFTKNSFSYVLIKFISPMFYIAVFFLVIGLWLSIWSVRTFYFKGGDGTPGPWKPIKKTCHCWTLSLCTQSNANRCIFFAFI